jgi:ABC-type Zn uptake system ZnuABC Zn-binding protein ZnuA
VVLTLVHTTPGHAQRKLRVVTTLPTFAAITRELTSDNAEVTAIARGDEDPHFVTPRPSFAALIGKADLFVVTGLDLELWVPAVLDRARNARVVEGAPGHVVASAGIRLLEVPENVSRIGGDVHVFGSPHIHTDPINAILIARNILAKLILADPANATTYQQNARNFEDRVIRRTFGDQLVDMLGFDALFELARNDRFWEFARSQTFQDKPIIDYLGGWLAQAEPFRDKRMVCYHKNWAYFSARFRVACAIYVEPKPGIPPSPGHLGDVVNLMRSENLARAVIVPEHVNGAEGVDDYFKLIDSWVSHLSEAFLIADRRRAHQD